MDNFKQKNKPETTELPNPLITENPDRDILGAWYGLTWKGMRERLDKEGVKITARILTEKSIGEVFYNQGLPPKLPEELYEWAEEIEAKYHRLHVRSSN